MLTRNTLSAQMGRHRSWRRLCVTGQNEQCVSCSILLYSRAEFPCDWKNKGERAQSVQGDWRGGLCDVTSVYARGKCTLEQVSDFVCQSQHTPALGAAGFSTPNFLTILSQRRLVVERTNKQGRVPFCPVTCPPLPRKDMAKTANRAKRIHWDCQLK